jgi:hypothetical protein
MMREGSQRFGKTCCITTADYPQPHKRIPQPLFGEGIAWAGFAASFHFHYHSRSSGKGENTSH